MRLLSKIDAIEEHLNQLVTEHLETPYAELFQAARYSLFSGGKRLRPQLTLATCEMLGGSLESALTPACAVELIHTYSMIHDDLPCMDDDDFRRDQPTLHRVVPEGLAVLTGDYLLTQAFEVIAHAPLLTLEQRIQMISALTRASGGHGMIGGQVMDLAYQGRLGAVKTLEQIHSLKTAALISAAVACGAIAASASPQEQNILENFSASLGLAFQIVDDLLDNARSDQTNKTLTYLSVQTPDQARQRAKQLLDHALSLLQEFPGNREPLIALAKQMVMRHS